MCSECLKSKSTSKKRVTPVGCKYSLDYLKSLPYNSFVQSQINIYYSNCSRFNKQIDGFISSL